MEKAATVTRSRYQRENYEYENTARKLNTIPNEVLRERKELKHTIRKNRERASYMSFSYVLFLGMSVLATFYICISYLQLNAECTNRINNINHMKIELSGLKDDNDEEYSRITSSVNLEEIKRIAIEELGMVYASKEQTVLYASKDSDYVRQYQDVPTDHKSFLGK